MRPLILKKQCIFIFLTALFLLLSGCSINQLAVNMVADILSKEGGTTFTGDEDPVLIGEALPFSLKLYESLLESAPEHKDLLFSTGQAFALYANAYVQTPAEMLPDEDFEQKEKMMARAKKLYIRGRNYMLKALYLQVPGFKELLEARETEQALALIKKQDLRYLFWSAAAWLGAFTTDTFDFDLMMESSMAVAMIEKVVEMDDAFEQGSAHDLLISYYGALPESMGGSEEKARHHFQKAIEYSEGMKAGPYLSLASSVCVKNQNLEEFQQLLNTIVSMDLDASVENRLLNTLARDKAVWMLEHPDNWFLIDEDFSDPEEYFDE